MNNPPLTPREAITATAIFVAVFLIVLGGMLLILKVVYP